MGKVIIYDGKGNSTDQISETLKKVIVYARVSSDSQTLAQQEHTVIEWLKYHDMKATHTVSDEGVSGGVSYKDRNLGKVVLPMLDRGDVLIVSEISRIGRNMNDINNFVAELEPIGVRLVVVQLGWDMDCADLKSKDKFIISALGFAAELEKELIQSRTRSAMAVRKEKLGQYGSFISKSGRIVTHLGNAKGVDLSKANEASAKARREKARNDPNNRIIWGVIGMNGVPTAADLQRMSAQLNRMGIKTAAKLDFTPERVRTAYHNMKKYMLNR